MKNLNILIVEDESLVAMELSSTIAELGYNVVDYATSTRMASKVLNKNTINLILMDVNLGEYINGIDFYRSLNVDIPVIYLTAYADDDTIKNAMTTGPLGYLVKPHKEEDLKALLKLAHYKIQENRIEVIETETLIALGEGYFFNINEDKLYFESVEIKLTLKELKLIKILIASRGNVVPYTVIEKKIWGDQVVNSSSMRTLLYRLRTKFEYKLIENEHNVGIKLKEKGNFE